MQTGLILIKFILTYRRDRHTPPGKEIQDGFAQPMKPIDKTRNHCRSPLVPRQVRYSSVREKTRNTKIAGQVKYVCS